MITKTEFDQRKEQFLTYLLEEKRVSANTHRSYAADLGQFSHFWLVFEKEEDRTITLETALELYISLLQQSSINASSVARKISCLNSLKKFLKKQGITIAIALKRPYIKLKEPVTLNIQEVFQLMDSILQEVLPTRYPLRDRAIIELLYATGLRCSELVGLELGAVNFSTRSIIIRAKNKKERITLFGLQASKRLQEYLQYERPEAQSPHERLFLNHHAGPLTERSVQRICVMFRQFVATRYKITPCALRHSFATHLLNNGADIETVQELLGHKTRISTERYQKITNKI